MYTQTHFLNLSCCTPILLALTPLYVVNFDVFRIQFAVRIGNAYFRNRFTYMQSKVSFSCLLTHIIWQGAS